jgi:acyl-coenzyme A synthetase/AMP-(fatty) acid ligase
MGYIGGATTTREKFAGNSFRTGDLGEEIAGEIFYRGRAVELIAWNGVRLSPWETERRLAKELGKRSAVVGLGPAGPAAEPILRVILEGSLTPAELGFAEAIAGPLATRLGLAVRIESLPSLPRNAAGKVLRQQVLDGSGS